MSRDGKGFNEGKGTDPNFQAEVVEVERSEEELKMALMEDLSASIGNAITYIQNYLKEAVRDSKDGIELSQEITGPVIKKTKALYERLARNMEVFKKPEYEGIVKDPEIIEIYELDRILFEGSQKLNEITLENFQDYVDNFNRPDPTGKAPDLTPVFAELLDAKNKFGETSIFQRFNIDNKIRVSSSTYAV